LRCCLRFDRGTDQPVSIAQTQSDTERQDMLRGGSTKKGIYNVLGLDGTDFSAPP